MLSHDEIRTFAIPATVISDDIDHYGKRGISLSRDASHLIIGSLRRDAYEMKMRGGEANKSEAAILETLAYNISHSLHIS